MDGNGTCEHPFTITALILLPILCSSEFKCALVFTKDVVSVEMSIPLFLSTILNHWFLDAFMLAVHNSGRKWQ